MSRATEANAVDAAIANLKTAALAFVAAGGNAELLVRQTLAALSMAGDQSIARAIHRQGVPPNVLRDLCHSTLAASDPGA